MNGSDGTRRRLWPFSVSRSLQVVAGALLLLIVGATVHQLLALRSAIIADTERQMARLDMVFAAQTSFAFETVDFILRNEIETLQTARAQRTPDTTNFNALLARRIKGVRQASDLMIADMDGRVIYSSAPGAPDMLPPEGMASLAFHQANPQVGLRISRPFRDAANQWTALLTRPIIDADGRMSGIGVACLNLAFFEAFYRSVELSENGSIILHLRDGTVLARFPHVDAAIGTTFADTPPFKDILSHDIAGTLLMESPIDGSIRVTAIRALRTFPLAIMVSVEQGKMLKDWRHEAWALAIAALVACVFIVGLLLLLARRSGDIERLVGEFRIAKDTAEYERQQALAQMAERERAEAALRQAQRIEAVGQLTGGVAHDFNNLLTVLIGNIDLLQSIGTLEPHIVERLVAMRAAAERGATLTGHLLAFARRQPLLPRPVDLNAVVVAMRDLLESALGRRVVLETRLADNLWAAMVDPTQIELVILNLAINARDAMPDGGVVTIETSNHQRGYPVRAEEAPPGEYVVVTVRDVGIGMTPEVQAKAFEPFFTTKGPGAGSGLGLSQVFGTARQSGGDVQIVSELGRGTAVSVFLPRALAPLERQAAPSAELPTMRASRATVLVVDDDEAVRSTTADILGALGYTVLQASDAVIALLLLEPEANIDVLLTDVAMPGMSGPELARQVRRMRPHLPIVFISGYADPEGLAGDVGLGRLVRKPFRSSELREQIEEALEEARAAVA